MNKNESMLVIAGPRMTEKTTKLASLVSCDSSAILFVVNDSGARIVKKRFPAIKDRIFSIGSESWKGKFLVTHAYFDDVEYMPRHLLENVLNSGVVVSGVSYTILLKDFPG
jgi:hypothetical protein